MFRRNTLIKRHKPTARPKVLFGHSRLMLLVALVTACNPITDFLEQTLTPKNHRTNDKPKQETKSPPKDDLFETCTYKGHTYYFVKKPKTWADAAAYAKQYGGYLVHLDSEAETMRIYSIPFYWLIRNMNERSTDYRKHKGGIPGKKYRLLPEDTDSDATDGSGYFWLGATDKDSEGTWVWNGDNDDTTPNPSLGTGRTDTYQGQPGAYQYWGRERSGTYKNGSPRFDGAQAAPDGIGEDGQDYAAMLFDFNWGKEQYGGIYRWNDLTGDNQLYFIVEVENQVPGFAMGRQPALFYCKVEGTQQFKAF